MNLQSLSFNDQVDDLLICQFANLSIDERCKAETVCTKWYKLLINDNFWIPTYKEVNPLTYDDKRTGIKAIVVRELKLAAKIIALIHDDKIAGTICPPHTLAALKEMPPLVYTLHIATSALKKDCTQFFVHLPQKFLDSFNEEKELAEKDAYLNEDELLQLTQTFQATSKDFPLLSLLVEERYGQFDPVEVLSELCRFLCNSMFTCPNSTAYIKTHFFRICSCIIKTHPDLSKLASLPSPIQSTGKEISFATFLIQTIFPLMQQRGFDITMDDLQRCSLTLEIAKTV